MQSKAVEMFPPSRLACIGC